MVVEQNSIHWRERYYAARPAATLRISGALSDVVADIQNPISKLRFLRDVMDRHQPVPHSFRIQFLKPISQLWLRCFRYFVQLPWHIRQQLISWSIRSLVVAACIGTFVLITNVQRLEQLIHAKTDALEARANATQKAAASRPDTNTGSPSPLNIVAETLPMDTLGVMPSTIWMADRGTNWELYSNGLRIETSYKVKGDPRGYRLHDINSGLKKETQNKPIGIVFHTSESDVWPLETDFNKQLRQTSEALLSYVQRQRAYNYVIDRFGRVFRIVEDETRANHAGYGIWANGDEVYLDINSAFLGVSFESRWEGGKTLPITRAQLIAGRNLTHYLRQRFAIAPEMCVTHGLTSVSPKNQLIGYHLDWARGFPFAAFGLPDQYAVTPPSMKFFGFGYNADFVRAVGNGWPGALAGKAAFADEAKERGVMVDALRAERKAMYLRWLDEAHASTESIEKSTNDSLKAATESPRPATTKVNAASNVTVTAPASIQQDFTQPNSKPTASATNTQRG